MDSLDWRNSTETEIADESKDNQDALLDSSTENTEVVMSGPF